jgi:hypothetical protein
MDLKKWNFLFIRESHLILRVYIYIYIFILSSVCCDYIRRVMDWQLDLLDHTQLHTITVYTLHNPLLQLQLFSEDCCSARILSRNCNCNSLLSCQLTKSLYFRRSVGQSIMVSSPIWGSWPDINYCVTVTVLSISGAPSDDRSGLSFDLVTWTASVQCS